MTPLERLAALGSGDIEVPVGLRMEGQFPVDQDGLAALDMVMLVYRQRFGVMAGHICRTARGIRDAARANGVLDPERAAALVGFLAQALWYTHEAKRHGPRKFLESVKELDRVEKVTFRITINVARFEWIAARWLLKEDASNYMMAHFVESMAEMAGHRWQLSSDAPPATSAESRVLDCRVAFLSIAHALGWQAEIVACPPRHDGAGTNGHMVHGRLVPAPDTGWCSGPSAALAERMRPGHEID